VRAAVDAELHERPLVDQQVDPLAGGELARVVLLGDLLLAAAEPGALAALLELLRELGERSGPGKLGLVAHRPFQTGSRFSKNSVTPSIASSVPSSIVSCAHR